MTERSIITVTVCSFHRNCACVYTRVMWAPNSGCVAPCLIYTHVSTLTALSGQASVLKCLLSVKGGSWRIWAEPHVAVCNSFRVMLSKLRANDSWRMLLLPGFLSGWLHTISNTLTECLPGFDQYAKAVIFDSLRLHAKKSSLKFNYSAHACVTYTHISLLLVYRANWNFLKAMLQSCYMTRKCRCSCLSGFWIHLFFFIWISTITRDIIDAGAYML